jgi:hypothetical protein
MTIVPAGPDGTIDFRNASATTSVDLLADVEGYFTSGPAAAGGTTFTPLAPARILDTRTPTGGHQGLVAGGTAVAVQVSGASGIPAGISAVAVNITAQAEAASGWLEYYPDGTPRPGTAEIQFHSGTVIAGMAIVPVAANGKIDIYNGSPGTANIIADVSGYFTAGTGGLKYHAIGATRITDTRQHPGTVASGGTLAVAQGATVAAASPVLALNITAVSTGTPGYLIAYAAGTARPDPASTLNYADSGYTPDLAITQAGGGTVTIYNAGSGPVHVVADCFGYFSSG